MSRHWYVRPRPRFDVVEAIKTGVIWTAGMIELGVLIAIIIAAGLLLASSYKPVLSHSFYPQECCSGNDCAPMPSRRVDLVAGGYLIDRLHFVPEFQARVSPDKQFHGCFPTSAILRCFFAPKPSM